MNAYRVFADENRAAAKAQLQAEGQGAGMGQVAKILGAQWRALDEEAKKVYLDKAAAAAEVKAAAAAAAAAAAPDGGATQAAEDTGKEGDGPVLPVSRVKRICRLDGDVRQVSGDAVRLVAQATELFIASLTAGAYTVAASNKRRSVRFADVEQHVMRRGKLWFLHDHMAPLRPKEKAKAAAKQAPKAALAAGEGGNTSAPRAITSFFAAAPAVAEEKEMETDGADE